MTELFKWLGNNPAQAGALIAILFAIVTIYLVAFLQGREVSFWPPKISARPSPAEVIPGSDIVIRPKKAVLRYGQTQQFKADVPRKPTSRVTWLVFVGAGRIDANGLYTAPSPPDSNTWPATIPYQRMYATIQVTSEELPEAFDIALVILE